MTLGEPPTKAPKRARRQSQQSAGVFDVGFDKCFDDFLDANAHENPNVEEEETSEEPEESTKKFYEAIFDAHKPLHPHTEVIQLDVVARLMSFKCQSNLSRDRFDDLVVVIGSIMPKRHLFTKKFYELAKILHSLKMTYQKMTYQKIDALSKGMHAI